MCRTGAVVWLVFVNGGAWAGPLQESTPAASPALWRPDEKCVREEDQRIHAALDEIAPAAHFENLPLEEVLQWFAEIAKINVHVEWRDLTDSGVPRDRPVTLNLQHLPRWRILRAILDSASGEVQLGYEVRDGVLLIATRDLLDRDLVTRVYPVRDLLYALIARWQTPQPAARPGASAAAAPVDLAKATDSAYREELARRSVGTSQPAPAVAEALLSDAENEFLNLLRQTVAPDAWRENGGSGCACIYNGVLVVRQCRTVQREVERLLADLRASGAANGPASRPPPTSK
jgi:hypothetical protein